MPWLKDFFSKFGRKNFRAVVESAHQVQLLEVSKHPRRLIKVMENAWWKLKRIKVFQCLLEKSARSIEIEKKKYISMLLLKKSQNWWKVPGEAHMLKWKAHEGAWRLESLIIKKSHNKKKHFFSCYFCEFFENSKFFANQGWQKQNAINELLILMSFFFKWRIKFCAESWSIFNAEL